jgi:hypothetical protein
MGEPEIRYLGDMQRLHVKPGDSFVLTLDRSLPHDQLRRLHEAWARFAGAEVPLLVLEPGMKLGIITKSED